MMTLSMHTKTSIEFRYSIIFVTGCSGSKWRRVPMYVGKN